MNDNSSQKPTPKPTHTTKHKQTKKTNPKSKKERKKQTNNRKSNKTIRPQHNKNHQSTKVRTHTLPSDLSILPYCQFRTRVEINHHLYPWTSRLALNFSKPHSMCCLDASQLIIDVLSAIVLMKGTPSPTSQDIQTSLRRSMSAHTELPRYFSNQRISVNFVQEEIFTKSTHSDFTLNGELYISECMYSSHGLSS